MGRNDNKGMYSSMDEPPNVSMFIRAGGKGVAHSKQTPVVQAITDAAIALTSVFNLKQIQSSDSNKKVITENPAEVIENRCRLYKQLGELCQLHKEGILTEDEYKIEKDLIMQLRTSAIIKESVTNHNGLCMVLLCYMFSCM